MTDPVEVLPLGWQPAAPADVRDNIDPEHRDELARVLVALKHRPRTGEWLDVDDRAEDLSNGRKATFRPYEG